MSSMQISESGSTRAASRKTRVYVFRQFLLDTYGTSYLSPGSTILDIAGGKGDLSWLLHNVDDIDSVVVDPRVTKNHILKSVEYLRAHPDVAKERAIPNKLTYQPLAALMPKLESKATFTSAQHLRLLVNEDLVESIRSYRSNGNIEDWNAFWGRAVAAAQEAQPLGYRETAVTTEGHITNAKAALETILSCKLVVGFHPDQATDPCIHLAQELNIPFCVVPCCVFPSEFPHRRLHDGTIRVRDYNQLIEYLKSKSDAIQTDKLNFSFTETAKNLVLYTLPTTTAAAESAATLEDSNNPSKKQKFT